MKGPAKLSLAIALALAGGNVFALGLGTIQVKSRLNQPLDAVIPVIADSPAEANGLEVALASAEDFQRVGLDRSRVDVPLEFSVGTDRGQTVIKVTTKDIVREPLLDFLIVANWSKGKLLREYTVLLDPPVTTPAAGAATVSPAHEAPRAKPQPLPPEHAPAKPKAKPVAVKPPHAESEHAKPVAAKPATERPAPAPRAAGSGEYGPVAAGETLSEIAGATRPDDKTNLNAMMLALLKANPNAFYRDNINALKRGAILRIPTREDIKAGGTAAEVAAAVHAQNQAWASNAPVAQPTLVAKTGAPKSETSARTSSREPVAASGSHLALVPPGTGKGKQTSSDHPGASSGTGNAQSAAELARTKEALVSREQEVSDLKSRVKDLEKINGDDKRLLTLKQNEIAELQARLKQLQAESATKPVTASVPAVPAKPAETKPAEVKPPETKPVTTAEPKPAETAAGKEQPKLTAKDIWGDINAAEKPKPSTAPAAPATATPAAPAQSPAPATAAPVAPAATAAEAKPAEAKPEPARPVSHPVAAKPQAPTRTEPMKAPGLPWWQDNNVLMAGGAALLIIGLLALMRFMRKPKAAAAAVALPAGHEEHAGAMAADEQHLLDQLAQNPGDAALSLQLLDLYYAHQDAAKFEAAAEAMYAHIADPTSPEWQQVRAMGEHLCPHNPLFGGHEDLAATLHDTHAATEHAEHDHLHGDDAPVGSFDAGEFHTREMPRPAEENFDFDLTEHAASVQAEPARAESPPSPPPSAPESARAPMPAEPVAPKPAEDFFAGEDAIGTKLDLAKAYLDMGDPEGARSMLDEVLAEGNDAQKAEARKLLAEIG
ncbi:MAG: fimbrial protein FimV [Proteobacteria bacterium]|nr:fimbrial protein FimV [Pseudomonadota bacterium]